MAAVLADQPEAVRLLVEAGAPVDQTQDGATGLFFAVTGNHPAIVQLLLDLGANSQRRFKGKTPLEIARDKGFSEVEAVLLKAQRLSHG